MPTLKVTGCRVDTKSIVISFSEQVDQTTALGVGSTNAKEPTNYTIFAPNSGLNPAQNPAGWTINVETDGRTVAMSAPSAVAFNPGDWVLVTAQNIALASAIGVSAMPNQESISRQVIIPGDPRRTTRDIEDAISYPILTEEVSYRPSPVGISTSGAGGIAGGGTSNLGQVAMQAVSDVLGWKANPSDPKGFIGALTQSFTLTDVEGHTESSWKPRSYAVQTDLGGGITGAQASLYMRAKDALDQSLSLLDGLYPLDPEADPEYVKALREMARSQMTEIVKEFGVVGLPSILRINTYFQILLGQNPAQLTPAGGGVRFDPDSIKGTLADLRDTFRIYFQNNPYNNSVEDEQDITNFRVISDYMTSLLQSWIANRQFFIVGPRQEAFFGTQLVLISRQLNVIAETVAEVRFALDSVFIGPNERQTLLLEFNDHSLPPMFLEDVLDEIGSFVADEGPRLLRDGGKISVSNNILPVVKSLKHMIEEAREPKNKRRLPDGFKTARVRHSLDDLRDQLKALIDLTEQVEQQVPLPEDRLTISSIIATDDGEDAGTITIIGNAFDPDAEVIIQSSSVITATPGGTVFTQFYSPQRIDVPVDVAEWTNLQQGSHTITVSNPNGNSVAVILPNGITAGPNGIEISQAVLTRARRPAPSGNQVTSVRRKIEMTLDGQPLAPAQNPAPGAVAAHPAAAPAAPPAAPAVAAAVPAPAAAAPAAQAVPPAAAPVVPVDQQLAALQDKHDDLQQKLNDIQTSHDALARKFEDAQKATQETLNSKFADVEKSHASMLDELKGWGAKIASLLEGTGKETKSKNKD